MSFLVLFCGLGVNEKKCMKKRIFDCMIETCWEKGILACIEDSLGFTILQREEKIGCNEYGRIHMIHHKIDLLEVQLSTN